ncbi:MAG TPA: TIM barrel protein, partial [Myxococcales bacterium]|nr:TIM barrel protein [Myxococcales bacterium]
MLGAHVSSQGGVAAAPQRGGTLRATAIQLFTKTPNQWREPLLEPATVERFRSEVSRHRLEAAVAHDSYLINLASPDPALRARSMLSFRNELERAHALGLRAVVSHPGNYMDDRDAGLERNARAYAECLTAVPGDLQVWIEGTAGSGT